MHTRTVTTLATIAVATMTAIASAANMEKIKIINARVQGDEPQWSDEYDTFVSIYGDTMEQRYQGVFDTVNTASVEGALMYVQAEGINIDFNSNCQRKNDMKYIVFYELQIVQPDLAMDAYGYDSTNLPEYSPFIAMDSGACTKSGDDIPKECKDVYGGGERGIVLGPSVGASMRDTDARAPYPDTVWYSYPNSCIMDAWSDKTDECRTAYPGGLCTAGVEPDGETCTFSYNTLGYLKIDDLVGITNMTSSVTGQPYTNYTEFCEDKNGHWGGVEFSSPDWTPESVTAIPFWNLPFNEEACSNRTAAMVAMYNSLVTAENHMTAIPSVAALTEENPPCYKNSVRCANAEFGCRRDLYSQLCIVCEAEVDGCVKASYDFTA